MNGFSAPTLVSIRNLCKSYAQKRALGKARFAVNALRGANLDIRANATLALVGESGAGKSTLARCLSLLEKPTSGQILFEGVNLLALNRAELFRARRWVQLVFQDPASALNPRMTAAEIIEEPLLVRREGAKSERRRRALELMDRLGLPAASARKHSLDFSGGQRQRLAIARALILRPKLLIFDESLSNLDLATRDSIVSLLGVLQIEHSLTYVHVLHDLRLASEIAGEIAVMHDGTITGQKSAESLFTRAEHPLAQLLLRTGQPLREESAAGISR